ncbi:MAG: crossover junction endodeoxyribonuclease RuvC [Bacteroidales bacterium]|nr:crossover junction endodeoxyribonuclease RuvC [Bacteroidales bacterium]
MEQRIILGIDPGTRILGYGVILVDERKAHYVDMGVVDLRKVIDHFEKLKVVAARVGELIEKYKPQDLAVEAPFYSPEKQNPQVILKLGRVQGAAIAAALGRGLNVAEYAPRKVKMSITGQGSASKEQVSLMLSKTLGMELKPQWLDATDALAIAMCHYYQLVSPLSDTKSARSWEDFLKIHPEKVKK